jgi:hypothetical protein
MILLPGVGGNRLRRRIVAPASDGEKRLLSRTGSLGWPDGFPLRGEPILLLFWRLDQIPQVAPGIAEHGDGPERFFGALADELSALVFECSIVAIKIVGVQKEKYAAAGLVADA